MLVVPALNLQNLHPQPDLTTRAQPSKQSSGSKQGHLLKSFKSKVSSIIKKGKPVEQIAAVLNSSRAGQRLN